MRKFFTLLLSLFVASMIIASASNVFAEENDINGGLHTIYSDDIDLNNLPIGEEIILYNQDGTTISVILEEPPIRQTSYVIGDSGWSGGSIPYEISTLSVKCSTDTGSMSYKMDVRGSDCKILRAYNLTYEVFAWTVNSTSLGIRNSCATSSQPAYATATIEAVLIEYGVVVESFGGYLTGEININGNFRVTYSFGI